MPVATPAKAAGVASGVPTAAARGDGGVGGGVVPVATPAKAAGVGGGVPTTEARGDGGVGGGVVPVATPAQAAGVGSGVRTAEARGPGVTAAVSVQAAGGGGAVPSGVGAVVALRRTLAGSQSISLMDRRVGGFGADVGIARMLMESVRNVMEEAHQMRSEALEAEARMWKDAEMAQMEAAGALTAMRAELQAERERREWEVAVVQVRSELELQRAEVRRLEGEARLRGVAAVATGGVGVSSVAKAAAVAVGGGAAAAQAVASGGVGVSSAAKAAAVAVGGGAAAAKATSGVGVSSSAAQAAAGAVAPEDGEWTTVVRRVPESFAAQLSAAAAKGVGDVGKIWVSKPPARFTAGGFGFVCACASCRRLCGVNGGERVIPVPAGAVWKSGQGGGHVAGAGVDG